MVLFAPLFVTFAAVPAKTNTRAEFERAVRALTSGDFATAEAGFLSILKAQPRNIGALGNLGVVYSRTGQADKAIAVYRKALALQPSDPQLLLNLGLAYLKAELESEALPIFRRLAVLRPQDVRAQELLATAELASGTAERAVTILEALRQHDSANPALLYLLGTGYLKTGRREQAKATFTELFASAPPAVASLAMCKAYYRSGLLEEAEHECRAAHSADPLLDGVERELGKVLVSRRDPAATEWLRKAIASNSKDAEALYYLGAVLVGNNEVQEAVSRLETARQLNPAFWGNYFYLGRARLQQGNVNAAIPLLEHAAELNSSESSVFYQLGRAYAAAGQPGKAKQAASRVRELKAQELQAETVPTRSGAPPQQ